MKKFLAVVIVILVLSIGAGLGTNSINQEQTVTSETESTSDNASVGKAVLTVENSNELRELLTTKNGDYEAFAKKHDDEIVQFEGYVARRIDSSGDTDHITIVAYELDEDGRSLGSEVWMHKTIFTDRMNQTMEEGAKCFVKGSVSERWTEYYGMLTLDVIELYSA